MATARFFFEQPDLKPDLNSAQMITRLTMVQWLQEDGIEPAEAEHFANQLYRLYKR